MLFDSEMRLIENDNSTGEQMGFDECRKLCESILKIVKMRLINVEVHFLQLKHNSSQKNKTLITLPNLARAMSHLLCKCKYQL